MIATKHLYRDFLINRRVYNLNRGYWKRMLSKIGEEISIPFYNEHFSNGTPFYDGNPIISAYIPKLKKSIRIIQEDVETESVEIRAWTEDSEHEDDKIQELVISLELSRESAKIATTLIEGWLQHNWDGDKIESEMQNVMPPTQV